MAEAKATKEWPGTLTTAPMYPPVSIITPTYNRRKFIPTLIRCIHSQNYPKERMEWLVYDDGSDPIWDILEPHATALNIRYFRSETKQNIAEKRNMLHKEARGKILVVMDDDDFYSSERVSHAVHTLLGKKTEICGTSRNYLYFTDDKSIWEIGPYNANHATFGTMAFTKSYALAHPCDASRTYAEEVEFTNKYTEPLSQLNPMKVMLVMCHKENTFNKEKLRDASSPLIKKTALKLRNFVKDAAVREFYNVLDDKK